MQILKKTSAIELGGTYPHHYPTSHTTTIKSPQKGVPPRHNKETIQSAHRIPLKLSPAKHLRNSRQSRNSIQAQEHNNSNSQLSYSKLSNGSKIGQLRPFLDRSNQQSVTKIFTKPMDARQSRGSSRQQRGPSIYFNHSSKTKASVPVTNVNSREVQLQRKLRILQGRVGELHRQKQQAIARQNEQNRRLHHENTTLKLKINDLNKIIDRGQSVMVKAQPLQESTSLKNAQIEISNLKTQIHQLQDYIASQSDKISTLTAAGQSLQQQLASAKNQQLQKSKLSQLKIQESIQQQAAINEQKQHQIAQLEHQINQYKHFLDQKDIELHQKQKLASELQQTIKNSTNSAQEEHSYYQQLKQKMSEKEQQYLSRLKEYQSKIQEYQSAYNQNQQLIKELQEQLAHYEQQNVIKEQALEESHADLSHQCLEFENNFMQAIQQKDQNIEQLQQHNQELVIKIEQNQQEMEQLRGIEEQKTRKLETASSLLEKMTSKFEQISAKYSELTQRYQNERSTMNKSEGFQGKCKKCDDLLRTVLRLNNQLNPRRVN